MLQLDFEVNNMSSVHKYWCFSVFSSRFTLLPLSSLNGETPLAVLSPSCSLPALVWCWDPRSPVYHSLLGCLRAPMPTYPQTLSLSLSLSEGAAMLFIPFSQLESLFIFSSLPIQPHRVNHQVYCFYLFNIS